LPPATAAPPILSTDRHCARYNFCIVYCVTYIKDKDPRFKDKDKDLCCKN